MNDDGHATRVTVWVSLAMGKPNNIILSQTARQLVHANKGLLAMDESISTCNQRFRDIGIPETAEHRRRYRELIVTTPDLERFISGAILSDETIRQTTSAGDLMIDVLIKKGIVPGIKVDKGTVAMAKFPDEKVTEGLDGLAPRLESYYQSGARFAKWRAVMRIGPGIPSATCMRFNAQLLARYAAQCQEAFLVPVVEPEVLMDGAHSIETCSGVTHEFLHLVFDALTEHRVDLTAMLLKPNMILPGNANAYQPDAKEVAAATLCCLTDCVPAAVPGIVFLSGGQSAQQATERLNAINSTLETAPPWKLSLSFSRAILQPALQLWGGEDVNITAAQNAILQHAAANHEACAGKWKQQPTTNNKQ